MSEFNKHEQSKISNHTERFENPSIRPELLSKANDEIIQKPELLNLDDSPPTGAGNNDMNNEILQEDNFVDCLETSVTELDEASQRDYESTMSEEQLNQNQLKAVDFKEIGNERYKNGEYLESIEIYGKGISICPLKYSKERSILYGNRAAAYIQLKNNTLAIQDCSKSLELDPNYTKVVLRRAKLYEESDKLDESIDDFKKVLELDSNCSEARQAIVRLPVKINERNEKLKEEMIGKLKDLGNMILKPFGLSTNNFQMKQDPNTGSYSVNFNQKPQP